MIRRTTCQATGNTFHRVAFTLMEMLVVVAIIVVLAGVGGAFLMGQLEGAKVSSARAQAKVIGEAAKRYAVEHNGVYPQTLDQMMARDSDGKGPYFETWDALNDPWGRRYTYDPNGSINAGKGAVVQIPDVYTTNPNPPNQMLGNWKEAVQ
jgi:general secretion pathway protein G